MTDEKQTKENSKYWLKLTLLATTLAFGMWFILWAYLKLIGSPTVP